MFYFALFFGCVVIILSIIIYDAFTEKMSIHNQNLLNELIPIYRGVFMFILYQWMLAFNVYGWNKYNVITN